jgi:capsular exopolysaccharide synthesis family protein
VPSKKDIKKQAALSGAAGLLGLGLVGGLVTVYEMRRKRVFGPSDPLFRQKLPLLGCLPDCAAPASPKVDAIDPAGRVFFEAVDKVKAVICRQLQRRKMQAVLVTSAAPGEGKSALAWHLALSLARSDRRTLFIDGNLRNPGLHNHFDIASHPGLSELLRGERTVPEVVQRTALDNLWCIAAGVCDETGRQALDKDTLRQVLDRARRDFDYVVIDTCSIREAVDPLYLAQKADATVLALRTFQSGTTDVERACERLTQLGTPLLGAVLTDPTGAEM